MPDLRHVHPALQQLAQDAGQLVGRSGGVLTVTSGYRSTAAQAQLYRRYQQGAPGLYNVQPPGKSQHERGLAVDMTVRPIWMLYALGERWEAAGGLWGGSADPVHFGLH